MTATQPLPAAEGIRLDGVTKSYARHGGSPVQALEPVSLDVAEGEFVTIIGPSGCGKSTLLRIIAGLLPHDEGTVTVGSCTPDEARRAKHFGLVPQTPALLPWRTVLDNVSLLADVNRRGGSRRSVDPPDPHQLLAQVGLAEFEQARPAQLSGGMQQRVALVRAVALGPPVLLMDEPFAALDEITRADMRYLLLDVLEHTQATCVFVTHSVDEAVALSDRVVVMSPRPGRITAIETIDLPRPRATDLEDDPRFHAHVAAVRRALRGGDR
ncbi:MAG: ABC transporter ATP-binding protein [Acidimicrobiales bacterium]